MTKRLFIISFITFLVNNSAHSQIEVGFEKINHGFITVTGKAVNAKLGAIIMVNDSTIYYLKGKDEWSKKNFGKTITIMGRHIEEKRTYEDEYFENGNIKISFTLPPVMPIIKKPRFKIKKKQTATNNS
jgi:hypothetical protein